MTLTIQSHRGDHTCDLTDLGVCERVFEKLTGLSGEPLPERDLGALPGCFREVKALTQGGTLSYYPVTRNAVGEFSRVERFDPGLGNVLFVAPCVGG